MALVSVFQGQEDLSGVSVYIIFLCNSYKEETWLFKELSLRNALIQQIDSNTHFANLYAINVTLKICAEKNGEINYKCLVKSNSTSNLKNL